MDKYGRITVAEHQRRVALGEHLHVFLDDEDVTRRCREADDIHGSAVLYKLIDGARYVDEITGLPALEVRHGVVRIEPGAPF